MGDDELTAIRRELPKAATLDSKKFHDLLQAAFNLMIDLFSAQIDERDREARQHRFKTPAVVQQF